MTDEEIRKEVEQIAIDITYVVVRAINVGVVTKRELTLLLSQQWDLCESLHAAAAESAKAKKASHLRIVK